MELLLFVVLQFILYLAFTIDYRAVATGRIRWVIVTNAAIPMMTYAMTKLVVETHRGLLGAIAVALGGSSAAVLGMWLTRRWNAHL